VLSTVTASGNVSTPEDLSLSFQQSGNVTSILVKVGDHVTAGEVLATVDNTNQQAALTSAQAQLAAAQAKAQKTITGLTSQELAQDQAGKTQSSVSVAGTQGSLSEAQQSAAVNKVGYQNAVDQAQATLTTAQSQLTTDQNELQSRRDELSSAQSSYDPNASSGETSDARVRRYQRDQSLCPATGGSSSPSSTTTTTQPADGADCGHVSYLLQVAQNVQSQEKTVAQDQTSVTQDQNAAANARQNQVSGLLKDQQQIATDQQQLISGQASLNSTIAGNAVKEKPPTLDQTASDQQSIASAQQQVTSAQKNLDQTSLVAPSDGTVSVVDGVVGGSSGGSGGSSSSSGTGSSSSSGTGSTGSTGSSSGSSGFITISQLSGLEVTASFSESDAGKLAVGQSATVTLDALPNQTLTGHIAEIAVSSTTSNNVVSYEVHVTLDHAPASVKPGMTADVAVVVQHADNVLTLPASAISGTGSTAVVTVKNKDGKESSQTVQIGLRGDQSVEITSGLSDGDRVVVKSTSAAAGGGATGLPGGGAPPGGGGVGGGGLGGGGLGGGGR
jgi:multidrug efflux pump subunit AcrA (membrane-fusion protein)